MMRDFSFMATGASPLPPPETINELIDRYLIDAAEYYQTPPDRKGNRTPTGHIDNLTSGLKPFRLVIGHCRPNDLTAEHLCAVMDWLLAQRKPNGETYTTGYINRLRAMMLKTLKWAAAPRRRWISAETLTEAMLTPKLEEGRTAARPSEEVQPVAEEHVKATLEALAEMSLDAAHARRALELSVIIDLLWHTGMRPGEACDMNLNELRIEQTPPTLFNRSREIMVYQPVVHKNAWRGKKHIRTIFIPPEGRRIIEDWRPRAKHAGRLFGYSSNSLGAAIGRINRERDIPHWTPNQLRHAFGTRMLRLTGIDVVQVLLGHKSRRTTEIYAKPDAMQAIMALLDHG